MSQYRTRFVQELIRWQPLISLIITGILAGYVIFLKREEKKVIERRIKEKVETIQPYKAQPYPIPQALYIADDKVPMDDPTIRQRFEYELLRNAYRHSSMLLLMKRGAKWFPVMDSVLAAHDVPEEMKYVAAIESYMANAKSYAGAAGYWQFMPSTARELGLEVNSEVDERYHPKKSTVAAAKYLSQLYDRFGNWADVLASYNYGMGNLRAVMRRQNMGNYFDLHLNSETSRYVFRYLAIREILEHPERYGFKFDYQTDGYSFAETKKITLMRSVYNFKDFAKEIGVNYKILKSYNPWLRRNSLVRCSPRNPYTLTLPKDVYIHGNDHQLNVADTLR